MLLLSTTKAMRPIKAKPVTLRKIPKIFYLCNFLFKKTTEKIAVMIILPPLNIYYMDKGIKFIEKKEIVEVTISHAAGAAKIKMLILSDYPWAILSFLSFS